jgi:hypothetical protein
MVKEKTALGSVSPAGILGKFPTLPASGGETSMTKEDEYLVLPIEPSAPPDFYSEAQPWGVGCSLMVAAFILSILIFQIVNPSNPFYEISLILFLEAGAILLALAIHDIRKKNRGDEKTTRWMRTEIEKREEEAQALSQQARRAMAGFYETLRNLPGFLREADYFLGRAEEEFQERAYAPFWDNIEQTAIRLGSFNANLARLETEVRSYNNFLKGRAHNFPPLLIQRDELPNPAVCADRLHQFVRMGQKDFEFATIWEHRKTQNVIVEGFRTLGEAVNNLGLAVDDSFSRAIRTIEESSARQLEEQTKLRGSFETAVSRWEEQKKYLYRS